MITCHPGYLDDYVVSNSSLTLHRVKELQCMIDPQLQKWIIDNRYELINQKDAIYGTNNYQEHLKSVGSPLWTGNYKK